MTLANRNEPPVHNVTATVAALQAAFATRHAHAPRDQIRALTGANAPRRPARPSRGASSAPTAPLPLPHRALYA